MIYFEKFKRQKFFYYCFTIIVLHLKMKINLRLLKYTMKLYSLKFVLKKKVKNLYSLIKIKCTLQSHVNREIIQKTRAFC